MPYPACPLILEGAIQTVHSEDEGVERGSGGGEEEEEDSVVVDGCATFVFGEWRDLTIDCDWDDSSVSAEPDCLAWSLLGDPR